MEESIQQKIANMVKTGSYFLRSWSNFDSNRKSGWLLLKKHGQSQPFQSYWFEVDVMVEVVSYYTDNPRTSRTGSNFFVDFINLAGAQLRDGETKKGHSTILIKDKAGRKYTLYPTTDTLQSWREILGQVVQFNERAHKIMAQQETADNYPPVELVLSFSGLVPHIEHGISQIAFPEAFWNSQVTNCLSGREYSLREIVGNRFCLVVLLRNLGSQLSRYGLLKLINFRESIQELGIQFVVFGEGSPAVGKFCLKELKLTSGVGVYADGKQVIFNLFLNRFTKPEDMKELMYGVFLLHQEGCVYSWFSSSFTDHVDPADIIYNIKKFYSTHPEECWACIPESTRHMEKSTKEAKNIVTDINSTFEYELGNPTAASTINMIENRYYYREHFYTKDHAVFLGVDENDDPVCICMEIMDKTFSKRAIIFSKKGILRALVPVDQYETLKDLARYFGKMMEVEKLNIYPVEDTSVKEEILDLEKQTNFSEYKFGVLFAKSGRIKEDEMYDNVATSPDYEEFLGWLGNKIELSGWSHFRGGLDNRGKGNTGTQSYFTTFKNTEIMYHVATMMPLVENDPLRKRYIGNDILVIIFKESASDKFVPHEIRSQFNHIFVVIQKVNQQDGSPGYWIELAHKQSIPVFYPELPYPPIIPINAQGREWFLTKLINAERMTIAHVPVFKTTMSTSRQTLLATILKNHPFNPGSKLTKFVSSTATAAGGIESAVSGKVLKVVKAVKDEDATVPKNTVIEEKKLRQEILGSKRKRNMGLDQDEPDKPSHIDKSDQDSPESSSEEEQKIHKTPFLVLPTGKKPKSAPTTPRNNEIINSARRQQEDLKIDKEEDNQQLLSPHRPEFEDEEDTKKRTSWTSFQSSKGKNQRTPKPKDNPNDKPKFRRVETDVTRPKSKSKKFDDYDFNSLPSAFLPPPPVQKEYIGSLKDKEAYKDYMRKKMLRQTWENDVILYKQKEAEGDKAGMLHIIERINLKKAELNDLAEKMAALQDEFPPTPEDPGEFTGSVMDKVLYKEYMRRKLLRQNWENAAELYKKKESEGDIQSMTKIIQRLKLDIEKENTRTQKYSAPDGFPPEPPDPGEFTGSVSDTPQYKKYMREKLKRQTWENALAIYLKKEAENDKASMAKIINSLQEPGDTEEIKHIAVPKNFPSPPQEPEPISPNSDKTEFILYFEKLYQRKKWEEALETYREKETEGDKVASKQVIDNLKKFLEQPLNLIEASAELGSFQKKEKEKEKEKESKKKKNEEVRKLKNSSNTRKGSAGSEDTIFEEPTPGHPEGFPAPPPCPGEFAGTPTDTTAYKEFMKKKLARQNWESSLETYKKKLSEGDKVAAQNIVTWLLKELGTEQTLINIETDKKVSPSSTEFVSVKKDSIRKKTPNSSSDMRGSEKRRNLSNSKSSEHHEDENGGRNRLQQSDDGKILKRHSKRNTGSTRRKKENTHNAVLSISVDQEGKDSLAPPTDRPILIEVDNESKEPAKPTPPKTPEFNSGQAITPKNFLNRNVERNSYLKRSMTDLGRNAESIQMRDKALAMVSSPTITLNSASSPTDSLTPPISKTPTPNPSLEKSEPDLKIHTKSKKTRSRNNMNTLHTKPNEKVPVLSEETNCSGCGKTLVDPGAIVIISLKYHPHCFLCSNCNQSVDKNNFSLKNSQILCSNCHPV
eukprot:TRINITY_DN7733_c0_g1_i1.p1 TRINITY_DN7733_c0_g1~~TRINITY_DN7733_c0_g1_i1.p1  ORF type:complete len:1661 (-),score=471.82 TRINITY_DN7733_c0_g1_i1:39-5021(-)